MNVRKKTIDELIIKISEILRDFQDFEKTFLTPEIGRNSGSNN